MSDTTTSPTDAELLAALQVGIAAGDFIEVTDEWLAVQRTEQGERRPRRFATLSRVVVVEQGHPHFARRAVVLDDDGGPRVDVRLDGETTGTVIRRAALVQTSR